MDESTDEKDFSQADSLIRGRQRFSRRAKKATDVINQLLARRGYGQQQSARAIEEHWLAVVDKRWHAKTRVGVIRKGVLEIHVTNSTIVQHLNFQKKQLLSQLQIRLPQDNLKDIRFRVGTHG